MTEKCSATCKDGSPCESYPIQGEDKCRMHLGTSSDGDSHDDNDFAAKAGAWADDFFQDFLTEEEQRRVKEGVEVLGDDAGAQELGRFAAMLALEQFRRTGDQRFLQRYESLCDKFQIAPDDAPDTEVDVTVDATNLSDEEKDMLNQAFDRDPQE